MLAVQCFRRDLMVVVRWREQLHSGGGDSGGHCSDRGTVFVAEAVAVVRTKAEGTTTT